jgi:hypothetical protein
MTKVREIMEKREKKEKELKKEKKEKREKELKPTLATRTLQMVKKFAISNIFGYMDCMIFIKVNTRIKVKQRSEPYGYSCSL